MTLTRWATDELRRIPGIEILAEPQLSIVAFRVARPELDGDVARPAVGSVMRERIRSKVDLPAPLRPRIAQRWPGMTARSRPLVSPVCVATLQT